MRSNSPSSVIASGVRRSAAISGRVGEVAASLLLLATTVFSFSLPTTVAAQTAPLCCKCAKAGQNVCVNVTLPAGESAGADCSGLTGTPTYRTMVGDRQALFEGFSCNAVLDAQGCTVVGTNVSSQCPAGTPVNLEALPARFSAPPAATDATASGDAGATPAQAPFQPLVPVLGVQIPGLTFTPASRDGDTVTVAYLAEYIDAGYRYLVGIIMVIAIIMVVWGGFRFLLGSAHVGNITKAKETIRDAIVGMLLVIGAFVILQTVNPATTQLRSLELSSVLTQDFDLGVDPDIDSEGGQITAEVAEARSVSNTLPASAEGLRANNRSSVSALNNVPASEFRGLDTDCLHTNTPVHPVAIPYLQRVSDEFCRLRGSHTDWNLYCGGYRTLDQQFNMWFTRCFYHESCTPTTLPIPQDVKRRLLGRDASNRLVYLPDPTLRDRERLRAILMPHFQLSLAGHASGVAVDCRCNVNASRFNVFHAPCTLVMDQAMKNAGMCKLRTEAWHFEVNQYRVSRFSCLQNWTLGLYQKERGGPIGDYRQCSGQYRYDPPACLAR